MATSIKMSWSKCKVECGKTGADDAMATVLKSIGIVNDKSTSLASADGEVLEAKASGGVVVARQEGEPTITLTTRVKEMDFDTIASLTGAEKTATELTYKTLVISDYFSVKLTPMTIGSKGIKIRKAQVAFRPGTSEEEGSFVDVTFTVLQCADGELYKEFIVSAEDWAD